MFSKGVWIALVVVLCGVMVLDRYNFLLGATICGTLSYFLTSSAIKWWLIGIYMKFQNTPMKNLRNRRKKVVTISSAFLLPAIEKIFAILKSKNALSCQSAEIRRHAYSVIENTSKLDVSDGGDQLQSENSYCGRKPCRNEEIKTFVKNIMKNFVHAWYENISSNPDFTIDVEYVVEETLSRACDKISRLNVNHLVHQMLIMYHNHIIISSQILSKKQCKMNMRNSFKSTCHECETHSNMCSEIGPSSEDIHVAMKDSKSETWYLINMCDILLDLLGIEEVSQCPLVHVSIRDILAQNLFKPLVNLISDPTWIYWGICCILGKGDELSRTDWDVSLKTTDNTKLNSPSLPNGKSFQRQTLPKRLQPIGHEGFHKRSLSCCSLSDIMDDTPYITFTGSESQKMSMSYSSDPLLVSMDTEFSDSQNDGPSLIVPPLFTLATPAQETTNPGDTSQCENLSVSSFRKASRIRHSHSLDSALSKSVENVLRTGDITLAPKSASLPRAVSAVDVEQALEIVEGSYNNKLFGNISIVGAEERFDTKRHNYTLYCIEYEISSRLRSGIEEEYYAKKTGIAWRRFKEFMALQERLEGHPELKKYLKGIKGPSKWLAAPFSKLDKKNVEARRLFLQDYLRKLCNHHELANSHELQQFLAYRGDASIAFVKKAPELLVPRLDKAVLRGLMGALDLIKTALPHLPQDVPSIDIQIGNGEKSSSVRSLLPVFRKNRYDCKDLEIDFVYKEEGVALEQMIYNHLERLLTSSPDDSFPNSPLASRCGSDSVSSWKTVVGSLQSTVPRGYRSEGDGCDSEEKMTEWDQKKIFKLQEAVEKEIPLADAIFDIIFNLIPPTRFISDDNFVLSLKVLFGQVLQRWLQKLLQIDEEGWVKCLHLVHEALWPQDPAKARNDSAKLLGKYRIAAFSSLRSLSSVFVDKIYSPSEMDESLNQWLDCLNDAQQNRSLVYQTMDVFVDMLCAQELHINPLI